MKLFFGIWSGEIIELFEEQRVLEDSLDGFDEVGLQRYGVLLHGVVGLEKILQRYVVVCGEGWCGVKGRGRGGGGGKKGGGKKGIGRGGGKKGREEGKKERAKRKLEVKENELNNNKSEQKFFFMIKKLNRKTKLHQFHDLSINSSINHVNNRIINQPIISPPSKQLPSYQPINQKINQPTDQSTDKPAS